MTPQQEAVLKFIHDYTTANGRAPAIREISIHWGVKSEGNIFRVICALEEMKYITRTAAKTRNIRLTLVGLDALGITACVCCGQRISA